MIQERKHLRENVPQMIKQQIPNHQLYKISHKMSPSLNNNQGKAGTDTQQEPVPLQFSSDEELPDPFATTTKTFAMKDPRSAPKKPKYSLRPKTLHI